MKNRLFAIGAMILMMTSCTQDELISSDNGKEPATAGSCLTLVGLSSPQTRVSIGDKTGDVYPVIWSEGDALGVFSRTAGTDINNVQSLLSDESIGQNSGVFTSDDVKMAEEGATELLIYYPIEQVRNWPKMATRLLLPCLLSRNKVVPAIAIILESMVLRLPRLRSAVRICLLNLR